MLKGTKMKPESLLKKRLSALKAGVGKWNKGKIPWNKGAVGLQVNWTKGKKRPPFSDEWKKNMGLAQLGKKRSKESIERMKLASVGRNKGIKRTDEFKRKVSESLRGEKCYNWKGGITPWHKIIRASVEYKIWRLAVFTRDNFTCVWCGNNKSGNLEADHIKRFADYPELRFAIDNGRTLCKQCHRKTDTYGTGKLAI